MTVKLNVGGTLYLTTADTLLSIKDSYFTSLLSGRFQASKVEDAYFIDRDGLVFRYVLDYLRNLVGYQCPTDLDLLIQLEREADFFLLPELKELVNKEIKKYQERDKVEVHQVATLKFDCKYSARSLLQITEQLNIPEMYLSNSRSSVKYTKSVFTYHGKETGPDYGINHQLSDELISSFLITNGYIITGRTLGKHFHYIDFRKSR